MTAYRTPDSDSIATQGALLTDWYAQRSCTAGRAAGVTGQSPIRTGLTKVGVRGSPAGRQKEDPTSATLRAEQGDITGQFGKHHRGDDTRPSGHGFDERFGHLDHLNAEAAARNPDDFKAPALKKRVGPRGVIHRFAGAVWRPDDNPPARRQARYRHAARVVAATRTGAQAGRRSGLFLDPAQGRTQKAQRPVLPATASRGF